MKIIKRNGTQEQFDTNKISKAIEGAFNDISAVYDSELILELTSKVVDRLDKRKNYKVEEIQDIIELTLMHENRYEVAKAFIEYRQSHKIARNYYKDMMDIVKDKLEADESASNDELQALALASDKVKELTNGTEVVKVIVVPKKLVNIVVKG